MKTNAIGGKQNSVVEERQKKLKHKEKEEMLIFQRNINNAEKLLLQFKEPSNLNEKGGYSRHLLMKLCNDERAYLEYKKGKIKFVEQK